MKFRNGDLTSGIIGYFSAAASPAVQKLQIILATSNLPVSQPVIDEIVRGFGALLLAVASRWLYNKLEKMTSKKSESEKTVEPIELKPLNKTNHGKQESDTPKSSEARSEESSETCS